MNTKMVFCVGLRYCQAEMEQLNPNVPRPALVDELVIFISIVEIGPKIALDKIIGRKIIGFLNIFANCKVEVPSP